MCGRGIFSAKDLIGRPLSTGPLLGQTQRKEDVFMGVPDFLRLETVPSGRQSVSYFLINPAMTAEIRHIRRIPVLVQKIEFLPIDPANKCCLRATPS